jgi:hypothetical protein
MLLLLLPLPPPPLLLLLLSVGSSKVWYNVSSVKITPLMYWSRSGVVSSALRQAARFASEFETPTCLNLQTGQQRTQRRVKVRTTTLTTYWMRSAVVSSALCAMLRGW